MQTLYRILKVLLSAVQAKRDDPKPQRNEITGKMATNVRDVGQ
jgi:hypothetical protein